MRTSMTVQDGVAHVRVEGPIDRPDLARALVREIRRLTDQAVSVVAVDLAACERLTSGPELGANLCMVTDWWGRSAVMFVNVAGCAGWTELRDYLRRFRDREVMALAGKPGPEDRYDEAEA